MSNEVHQRELMLALKRQLESSMRQEKLLKDMLAQLRLLNGKGFEREREMKNTKAISGQHNAELVRLRRKLFWSKKEYKRTYGKRK